MLLTLILNLDMAAGLVVPIIPPTGGGGYIKKRRPFRRVGGDVKKSYEKQKRDDTEIMAILNKILAE